MILRRELAIVQAIEQYLLPTSQCNSSLVAFRGFYIIGKNDLYQLCAVVFLPEEKKIRKALEAAAAEVQPDYKKGLKRILKRIKNKKKK